ncbi:MAG: dihydrolipoyllysine-residue acetyltransferase [Sterolibacterium sp.]|nr:dihydrolipoyllysine-residue acetyltransferase [Sterolibacterium sp.]MBP9799449.1 dihydrolipoyllysine-residue acetyltransferase [Sterolibacterium sp.]
MAQLLEIKVPDIGGFHDVPVIEIAVRPGDTVAAEDTLLTLESDKATMDVPAPVSGVVRELRVKVGDKIGEGTLVALIETVEQAADQNGAERPLSPPPSPPLVPQAVPVSPALPVVPVVPASVPQAEPSPPEGLRPLQPEPAQLLRVHMPTPAERVSEMEDHRVVPHASPSIRAFARELGVDLLRVHGSGPKGRITREDVQSYVKNALATPAVLAGAAASPGGGLDLLPWPKVDFSKFGAFETRPLSRIKKISGANLARNWAMIPHVTQFDEVDIGVLEEFRVALNKENEKSGEKSGIKLTLLAFLIKASVAALKKFPEFNASLDGDNLILKQYYHIGFAADTPNGLVVPVIRDVDQKGLLAIAEEMASLSKSARDGKLQPAQMQGGCFSISSLGGIGGTAFTPIINAPEVAILGVSKGEMKPKWDGSQFQPRLMLPLSLSYDHRVIDGAAAARFITYLGQLLADMRRVLL